MVDKLIRIFWKGCRMMKSHKVKIINSISLIMMFFVLAGVSSCKDEHETVILKPDSKKFYFQTPGYGNSGLADGPIGIPCGECFWTMGQSCQKDLPSDDSTIVGYSHSYSEWGPVPVCKCWEYVNCVYRGYVGFNLEPTKYKGILTAHLKWDETNINSAGDTAGNQSCLHKIYFATEPWRTDELTAGELVGQYDPNKPHIFDVSTIIRGWNTGAISNYGFFLIGSNESTDNKNNNKCLTTMTNLRLELLVPK